MLPESAAAETSVVREAFWVYLLIKDLSINSYRQQYICKVKAVVSLAKKRVKMRQAAMTDFLNLLKSLIKLCNYLIRV